MKKALAAAAAVCVVILFVLAASFFTGGDRVDSIPSVRGKTFQPGKNDPAFSEEQLDLTMSDFTIRSTSSGYAISFVFNGKPVRISGGFIPAKFANLDGTSYLFAPERFSSEDCEYANILLQLSPKGYDLSPLNSGLEGRPVMTLTLTDRATGEILLWQFAVSPDWAQLELNGSWPDTEKTREAANEFWYFRQES